MKTTRKTIIAGNWKMFLSPQEGAVLAREILSSMKENREVETVLCPPSVTLTAVGEALRGSEVRLGAQNIYWEDSGAFTGEISASMLMGWCKYVIVGHSERRLYFGETDKIVHRKVKAALANDLQPIICVGENADERETGRTAEIVRRQIQAAYSGLTQNEAMRTVVAYEPVWAIGAGKAATPSSANEVCADDIRASLHKLFGEDVADTVRVQYGGSVDSDNVAAFMRESDIDGALVGGASLSATSFCDIVQSAS